MAATAQTTAIFPDLIDSLVSRFGDTKALIFGDESISFWELADRSMRLSQGLRDLGTRRGDVAAIWFQNDPNWPVAFLACARVGANAIAPNTRFRQAELTDVFESLAPRVIFYQQSFREMDFSAVVDGACRASGLKNILEIFDTAPAARTRLTV